MNDSEKQDDFVSSSSGAKKQKEPSDGLHPEMRAGHPQPAGSGEKPPGEQKGALMPRTGENPPGEQTP